MSYQTLLTNSVDVSLPMWQRAMELGFVNRKGMVTSPFFVVEVVQNDHLSGYETRDEEFIWEESKAMMVVQRDNYNKEDEYVSSDAWATRYLPRPILRAGMGRYVHREF